MVSMRNMAVFEMRCVCSNWMLANDPSSLTVRLFVLVLLLVLVNGCDRVTAGDFFSVICCWFSWLVVVVVVLVVARFGCCMDSALRSWRDFVGRKLERRSYIGTFDGGSFYNQFMVR